MFASQIKVTCNLMLLLTVLVCFVQIGFAQEKSADSLAQKSTVSLELNLIYPIAFQGLGVNAYYDLPSKWSVGIGVVYGGLHDIPRFSAGNFFTNQENINLRWLYEFNVRVKYFFDARNEGFYAQANAGYEAWRVRPDGGTSTGNIHTNAFIVPVVGYNWFPFAASGFYIDANLSPIFLFAGPTVEQQVGTTRYQFRNNSLTVPGLNVNVGWRF
jgi:hypothetical protein